MQYMGYKMRSNARWESDAFDNVWVRSLTAVVERVPRERVACLGPCREIRVGVCVLMSRHAGLSTTGAVYLVKHVLGDIIRRRT